MRTNIVLNDDLIREAQRYSRAKSKTELVEEALRVFVESLAAAVRRETYATRLQAVHRAAAKIALRTSSVELLRGDRERS